MKYMRLDPEKMKGSYLSIDYCDKECFANLDNKCQALSVSYRGECPFQRTDITMEEQMRSTKGYVK